MDSGIDEATVEDSHSPESLEHESESLKLQQASLDNKCADWKSMSFSAIPLQRKPINANVEMEPVSPSQGFRPSNLQGIDEVTVEDSHSPESLEHESESLKLQQASLDYHCADLKSRSFSAIPLQCKPIDADVEMEPVSPSHVFRPSTHQGVDETTVEDSHSPESLEHESESLKLQQASLDYNSDLKSVSFSAIPLQSKPIDADVEMEPVNPSHGFRPSNPQGITKISINSISIMAEETVDLTTIPESTRSGETRWRVWEKSRKAPIVTDATLVFRRQRIIPDSDYIITKTNNLVKIPPQSLVTKLRAELLSMKDHVLVWDGYGVFDWNALNSLNNLYEEKLVAKEVQEEFAWIRNQSVETTGINQFMFKVWHDKVSNKDRESILCNRLLTDGLIQEVLDICNERSTEADGRKQFLILNNLGDSIVKERTTSVHIVINVTRKKSNVYVTPATEKDSHWTYLCVNCETNTAIYNDSLGWDIPVDLKQRLSCIFSDVRGMAIKALHEPGQTLKHICSANCSKYAPFQSCGSVCGVAALSLCILSFNEVLWEKTVTSENCEIDDKSVLSLIRNPTRFSDELRMTIMSCLERRDIALDVLKEFAQNASTTSNKQVYTKSPCETIIKKDTGKETLKIDMSDLIQSALKRKHAKDSKEKVKKVKKMLMKQKDTKTVQEIPKVLKISEHFQNLNSECTDQRQNSDINNTDSAENKIEHPEKCIQEKIKTNIYDKDRHDVNIPELEVSGTGNNNHCTEKQAPLNMFEKKLLKKVLKRKKDKKEPKKSKEKSRKLNHTIKSLFVKMKNSKVTSELGKKDT
ncbi:uncharacterized protein LOC128552565 [Mercenaria mercenaria]|uniref:uncharacterized protein LOC128552565 n=1 Tax=Mercenaria mercenaria TaxID=6596 RepID=UPI00234F12C8|nr:uncharacterized protein LOC128552565 [Mercenaria mercenaria]